MKIIKPEWDNNYLEIERIVKEENNTTSYRPTSYNATSGSSTYLFMAVGMTIAFIYCAILHVGYRHSSSQIEALIEEVLILRVDNVQGEIDIPEAGKDVVTAIIDLGEGGGIVVPLSVRQQIVITDALVDKLNMVDVKGDIAAYSGGVSLAVSAGFFCAFFMIGRISGLKTENKQLEVRSQRQRESITKAKRHKIAMDRKLKAYSSTILKTKANEQKLKDKITEADAVEKELKEFVDTQIKTNEQLLIAENKLKNLLEKEQESKAIINQTLDRLKETQGQLVHSEKMASLGQLTAGIAHEINNPVNFIYNGIGSLKTSLDELSVVVSKYEELERAEDLDQTKRELQLLKAELEFDQIKQDLSELIFDIKEGAVRTIEIVKGLRVFSRLDEEDSKEANINECLDATVVLLKNKMKNRIQLDKDLDPELPMINCFPGQLNQVFMNILTNAIQAIPEEQKDAHITVKTVNLEDRIQIVLGDNGTGMSEEVKQRIFEPFFTTKPVGVGTGLGMSISYGIIEKHHGDMSVNSVLGEGSEFVINLPKQILPVVASATA